MNSPLDRSKVTIKINRTTIVVFFLSTFVLLSSYSHRFAIQSVPILGRLTPADVFAILGIILSLLFTLKLKINKLFISWMFLVFCFSIGLFVTQKPFSTFQELLILLYLGVLFLTFTQYFTTAKRLRMLFILIAWTSLLSSLIGLNDIFSPQTGLPQLINRAYGNRIVSGTFINGGQAGAYLLVTIILLFVALISKLKLLFSKYDKLLITISIIFSLLYFLISVKIAAYIGLFTGILFYFLFKRKFKILIPLSIFIILTSMTYSYLVSINHKTVNRFRWKYNTRVVQNISDVGLEEGEFIYDNFAAAITVFIDNPLTGSGIGGFDGVYHRSEVHSTYVKLLGETGFLGIIGYLIFIYYFISLFRTKGYSKDNSYKDFLSNLLPFVFGFFISWGYTYHLRKREFWILIFVVYTANYLMKEYDLKQKMSLTK